MSAVCSMFGCSVGHAEACYDFRNREMLRTGALSFRLKRGLPNAPQVVQLKCFNRDEAEKAEAYMKENYPDVPFRTTWLTWPQREH